MLSQTMTAKNVNIRLQGHEASLAYRLPKAHLRQNELCDYKKIMVNKHDKICNKTTCTGMSTMLNFLFVYYTILLFLIYKPLEGPYFGE